ncbi:MAG TPA: DNA polymerase III subunit gamma/tau [Thermoanaerobaculia bacterium]|nr:DNA polymerase III subunit gamma/tau [Thermoanaerobaculia bacterium]
MSYQALARKYRPQSFHDIVGQETTVRTLQNAIRDQRIHHAYLFSGVRGVGKTTSARILAKALNCIHGPAAEPCNECSICREITEGIDLDVREIDAATYTGVDNVRELRDVTQYEPARDRYRVFIIDEAHMLSIQSWNALLKLIEEPPEHVIFMFATTEMNKVPTTIISRVQKLVLRKMTLGELLGHLTQICEAEGIKAEREALEIVARRGEGSVRDALSLLDQVIAFAGRDISVADVATVLSLSDTTVFARLITLIGDGDHGAILETLNETAESGRDFKVLYRDLLNFVRNLLLVTGGASESMLAVSPEDLATIKDVASRFSYSDLLRIANLLLRDDETVNKAEHQRLAVELALLKAATFPKLKAVEEVLAGGGSVGTSVRGPEGPPPAARPRTHAPTHPEGLNALTEKLAKARPLIASYIDHATSGKKEGSKVTWTFDDQTFLDYVNDAKATIEQLASELYGETMTVETKLDSAQQQLGRRVEDKPSALREDPVFKAFQKHLGGEIVEGRRSK